MTRKQSNHQSTFGTPRDTENPANKATSGKKPWAGVIDNFAATPRKALSADESRKMIESVLLRLGLPKLDEFNRIEQEKEK